MNTDFVTTPHEESQYRLLVDTAKADAAPEAAQIRETYIASRAEKLVSDHGIAPEQARAIVQNRISSAVLDPADIITFQQRGAVPVAAILADPTQYHEQTCADPVEPEEGLSKAKVFVNPDGSIIINSYLHGGRAFILKKPGAKSGTWFSEAIRAGSVARFLDRQPPELDFVSEDSLMAGTVGLLVGPGAVGKTTLLIEIAAAVATGRDILPGLFTPTKPGKVLICAAEDNEAVLHHRFAALANELFPFDSEAQDLLRENLLIISVTGHDLRLISATNGSFALTEHYEMVRKTLAGITGLRMIAFDPQSRWYGGEENDNGAGTFYVSCLEKIAEDTGAAVLSSHHVTKRAGYGNKGDFSLDEAMHQDASRGASGLTNAVRWQMNLFGLPEVAAKKLLGAKDIKPGQYLAAKVSKKNYGPPEQVYFLERGQGGVFSITAPAEQRMAEDLERISRSLVLNAVTTCEGRQMTKRMLIDDHMPEWKKADQRVTRPVMEQAVAACIVHMELFEREGKNAKGRSVTYLSRISELKEATINNIDMFDTVN